MATWLLGYPYRQTLTIAAGVGASTDFQYPVKVYSGNGGGGSETLSGMTGSKIYVKDHCNADFSNIAFTSSDGVSLLDHWRQTYTASTVAVYWVETPDATAAQTIYVYYGAGATLSNQANTFVDVISGVVGAWNMEEANVADPVLDYSGNGNTGTPTDTTIIASRYLGKNARYCNGASSFIQTTDAVPITGAFSFAFDIKADSTGNAGISRLFINYEAALEGVSIHIVAGFLYFRMYCGTTFVDTPNLWIDYRDDAWHNIVATWNPMAIGHEMKLYVDKELKADVSTLEVNAPSAADGFIGQFGGVEWYKGGVGGLEVFDAVALSQVEVNNIFDNYPDVSLEAGKVLVRKWATTTNPAHSSWSGEERWEPAFIANTELNRRRMQKQQRRRNAVEVLRSYLEFKVAHPFLTLMEKLWHE